MLGKVGWQDISAHLIGHIERGCNSGELARHGISHAFEEAFSKVHYHPNKAQKL